MLAPSLAAALPLPPLPGAGRAVAPERSPRRAPPRLVLVVVAAVVALDALAGTPRTANRVPAADAASPPLGALLQGGHSTLPPSSPAAAATPRPLDAYLVTSPRDCATNLGVLDLLARETIAPRIRLAGALVVTPPRVRQRDSRAPLADSVALSTVRDAIAARGLHATTVRVLDPATGLLLRRIGYRATPFLVIVDSAGTLRFATPPSLSFDEYHGLAHALAALAGSTP